MKREFLKSLGLEEEAIDKILDEASKDIGKEKAKRDALKAARQAQNSQPESEAGA